MQNSFRTLMLVLSGGAGAFTVTPALGQMTHVVRMVADPSKQQYRFEPSSVQVSVGDLLVFRVASGAPHSVVFESGGLSSAVKAALNASMPGRSGELSSPLLTSTGSEYRMVIPQVAGGRYAFYCLPHRAYDMRGTLVVK